MTAFDYYLNYVMPGDKEEGAITDAPKIYHEAIFYAVVGILLGRRRWFPFGDQNIYPNMWLAILGESSIMRKSTALAIGTKMIRYVQSNIIFPNEFTSEKLLEILQQQPTGAFVFYELSTFLESMEKEYNYGLRALLTELFDAPPFYARKTKSGDIEVKEPTISIVAASTPHWLKMSETNIKGGFLTRMLFIHADPEDKVFSKDIPTKGDKKLKEEAIKQLADIYNYPAEIEYSLPPESKKMYVKNCREVTNIQDDPANWQIKTLFSRHNIYTIKVAMIIQTILDPGEREIGELAMDTACKFILRAVVKMANMFHDMPRNKEEEKVKKVLDIIKREGRRGVSRSQLLRDSHMLSKDLNNVLQTLKEYAIEEINDGEGRYYKIRGS